MTSKGSLNISIDTLAIPRLSTTVAANRSTARRYDYQSSQKFQSRLLAQKTKVLGDKPRTFAF